MQMLEIRFEYALRQLCSSTNKINKYSVNLCTLLQSSSE